MILVVDLGNSTIFFGVFNHDQLISSWRMTTNRTQSEDQYAMQINDLLKAKGFFPNVWDGVIISSVVPPLTLILFSALKQISGLTPVLVAPGIKTGLMIRSDNPSEVGADLIVGAVATLAKYKRPAIVIDLGTATKLYVLDQEGAFIGALIIPGIKISADALTHMATQLPHIALVAPEKVIGRNTPDAMNSGLIYGTAEMIDGLIKRIEDELGYPCEIIMTGGLAPRISPHLRRIHHLDETLILDGLQIIYKKNIKK